MSSLIQSEPKVEGKRGQEDVSGSLIGLDENEIKRPKPSSHGDEESLLSLVMRRQRYYKDLPEDPDKTLVSILWRNANLKKDLPKDANVCRCGHRRCHAHAPDHLLPRDPRYGCIPGILVPRFLWPFLEEMIAKSDDRTVVASGLSHEINDDTCFLELFKPFGEVISANLAVRDPEHNRGGLFGFVTFLTKEAAKQAFRTLNGGSDQRIRKVIRAKQINMPPMDPRYRSIPGIFVPPLLWPFVEEMTAKSDDKTVLASNLTLEIDEDTCLLELFKPYGEVIRANLAPIDPERNRGALFGFVTFVTKEGAEQAIRTLNGSGPYGWDKRILKVNWAKQST